MKNSRPGKGASAELLNVFCSAPYWRMRPASGAAPSTYRCLTHSSVSVRTETPNVPTRHGRCDLSWTRSCRLSPPLDAARGIHSHGVCLVSAADLKLCTGLSHTVVATSAIGSCIYGLLQRSPTDPTTTLLNADLALQFVPAMLFGVSLGAIPAAAPLCASPLLNNQRTFAKS